MATSRKGCSSRIKQFVFNAALACYLSAAPDAEQEGGDPDVLLQVGRCCKGIGNYERAIECLEKANRERRDDARILAELADCYSLVNESRLAKAFFREAFFIDPQAVDLEGLESPLVRRLAARVRSRGIDGPALDEWIPVVRDDLGRVQREAGDEAARVRQAQAGDLPAGEGNARRGRAARGPGAGQERGRRAPRKPHWSRG